MILNREPAAWAAAFRALLALVAMIWFPMNADQQGALNTIAAIVLAAIVAISVKAEKAFAFVVGLIEAIIYAIVTFGWTIDEGTQATVVAAVAAIVAIIQRDRVVAPVDANGDPQ